jgi:hypothetical protein
MSRHIIFVILLVIPLCLKAQPYEHSVGVRAGYSSGIVYKGFFLHRMSAIGVDLLYNRNGFNISAMYEMHWEIDRRGRWLAYAGGGFFGGNWDEKISSGLCGVVGVEYIVRDLPLNFGVDWKPLLNLYREFNNDLLDFGITIRYRFRL